jgi:hypothetical protein
MDKLQRTRRELPKPRPIARRRHNFIYLLLGILFGVGSVYLFFNFPPTYKFGAMDFAVPILPIFLATLAGTIFCTLTFFFREKIQGIIVSTFVVLYLVLRLIGLTHWIFLLLTLALFITAELFVIKKK